MSLDQYIQDKATYWATSSDFDASTRDEIQNLIAKKDEKELTDRFYKDLEFGTGGMRGILGAGTARMNVFNIRKATTAFALYLREAFPSQQVSIGISYDSRNFSREYAEAVAEVMAAHEVRAYITKELRPVPMLSYLVRMKDCQGGVCITASHNPPNYNGYKVYWATGGQIIPPHDKAVIDRYNSMQDYSQIKQMSFAEGCDKGLIVEVGKELDDAYYKKIEELSIKKDGREDFKIAYTPLHGTAGKPLAEAFKRFGFKDFHVVAEQAEPDGSFPTVEFPNPEDPNALKMAVALGEKIGADLVLGTDPDCDRIGIVYRDGNQYKYLNGNQIGCLLTYYVLKALKSEGRLPENPMVIKTIVTTKMQQDIAESFGAYVENTLTGFKWICQVIDEYETGKRTPYRKYVCGGEESYGFLMDSFVRDKDGLTACCLAAEMTAHFKAHGQTLTDVLNDLYRQFGVYQEKLHTLTLPGKEGADKISAMMEALRKNPPKEIDGTAVSSLSDVQSGEIKSLRDGKWEHTGSIDLPSSNVLQFELSDGTMISARPSGTEPKIKFYMSVRNEPTPDLRESISHAQARLDRIQKVFVNLSK